MQEEVFMMSNKSLDRLEIIQMVIDRRLSQKEAARRLGLSSRQIRRLQRNYLLHGATSLSSKNRGKPSNRGFNPDFRRQVITAVKSKYKDFGPSFAAEKLQGEGLNINRETLRQWMIEENIWEGKKRRRLVTHQSRTRRSCLGELIQIDGSPHDWFEGRSDKCCLLVFIDDATSRLMSLRFEPTETTEGYFRCLESYILEYGRPEALYSDKAGIFRVNHQEAKSGLGETQFHRGVKSLGIELICANSPQAKGRVERANSTLQDRLVKEMRLRGINNIDQANAFIPEFIKDFNKRFAKAPAMPENKHLKARQSKSALRQILSLHFERKLSKNLELSYENTIYQIQSKTQNYTMRGARIKIIDDQAGQVSLFYKGKALSYKTITKNNHPVESVSRKELDNYISNIPMRTSQKSPAQHVA
jgi:hypothetical protein